MNKKAIIAIVAVIIVAILGILLFLGSGDTVLSTLDASITLPNNYTVDDKGFLDVVNYFGIDNVCAIRLKRNNINVNKERGERNLNQIIPDSCSNLHIVENNTTINDCCLNIISILREKWPSFFDDFYSA